MPILLRSRAGGTVKIVENARAGRRELRHYRAATPLAGLAARSRWGPLLLSRRDTGQHQEELPVRPQPARRAAGRSGAAWPLADNHLHRRIAADGLFEQVIDRVGSGERTLRPRAEF